jgi:tetratricopeptide (TPR) repeat protein
MFEFFGAVAILAVIVAPVALYQRWRNGGAASTDASKRGGNRTPVMVTAGLFFNKPPEADRIASLHAAATQFKTEKEWDAAIAALREAEPISVKCGGYPMAHYLRLPLFLQQAGRFQEAMTEFERLLSKIEGRIDREFSHRGVKVRRMLAHAEKADTYEKMALAAKREKRQELETEFSALSEIHRAEHAKLMRQNDAEDARKDAALRRKLGLKPRN